MRTVVEHQTAVRNLLAPLRQRVIEQWRVGDAMLDTRVLAADLLNPIDLPPFDNSQMDGYAVGSDTASGIPLTVGARIAAGSNIRSFEPGTAAPIMTGAPIPLGADAVIPIEEAVPPHFLPEDGAQTVVFQRNAPSGSYVRRRGSDLRQGEMLLAAGTRLGPAQWGVLAAAGLTTVPLIPRVRVLLVSTGNELVAPGRALAPGEIYDANGTSMAVALAGAGAVVESIVAPDSSDVVSRLVRDRADDVDLVLTTGGVSQGTREVVRDVFEGAGVEFVTVAMQPGGPQGLGSAILDGAVVPIVSFPGNPVSALVSFEMFLRPVLRELHGLPATRRSWTAALSAPLDSPADKHQVRRGRVAASGDIELIGGSGSHLLHNYAASTVLAHVPLGVSHLDAGEPIEVWSIDD
ncbi:MAG TPA: gephyrin-like molybdotransferase Glp [Galbitalea sp.]|jgi:molybdopterin molybdotransferase|nr:gephyrin-like molybdotransferase Glp [Galbitalea sp.]